MTLRTRIAHNLKAYRNAQGMTQAALATRSAVSRSYVSDIKRAKVSVTLDVLERLTKALGVDPYALTGEPLPSD
ncbi:helix-turn-helix transcriptional regulator [Rhodobacteraceae bacterium LMO-12]|nr:helix-turn-helix transcriptional regulator [Rhodobacteraceae bacterium LMO-JJ12]